MKAGRPSKKSKKQAANGNDSSKIKFRVSKALQLIDKNSRTFQKIAQLLDALPPVDSPNDAHLLVSRRIEKLKMRLNRRLIKLAKWADLPEHERQQVPTAFPPRVNLQPSYNNTQNRSVTYPANPKVNYTQPVRFHQGLTPAIVPQPPIRAAPPLPRPIAPAPTPVLPSTSSLPGGFAVSTANFPGITRLLPSGVPRGPNYALLQQKMAQSAQAASSNDNDSGTSKAEE